MGGSRKRYGPARGIFLWLLWFVVGLLLTFSAGRAQGDEDASTNNERKGEKVLQQQPNHGSLRQRQKLAAPKPSKAEEDHTVQITATDSFVDKVRIDHSFPSP